MTTVGVSSTTPKYVDVLVNIGDFSSNQAPPSHWLHRPPWSLLVPW